MPDQKSVIFSINKRMDRNLNPTNNIVKKGAQIEWSELLRKK